MTLAALKSHFESPVPAGAAPRHEAEILPWAKSARRSAPAVRDTLGGHLAGAGLATYALFNFAYVLVHYAI
jgi:hypothetical protein